MDGSARSRLIDRILIGLLFAGLAVAGVALANGYSLHPVLSGSMEPAMRTGSLALTRPVSPDAVTRDMVVTVASKSAAPPVAHRVTEVHRGPGGTVTIHTKGDANNAPDLAPHTVDEHTTEVLGSVPLLGYIAVWLSTPGGMFGAVLAWLGVFVLIPRLRRRSSTHPGRLAAQNG